MRLFAAPFSHPAGVARRPLHEAARSAYARLTSRVVFRFSFLLRLLMLLLMLLMLLNADNAGH